MKALQPARVADVRIGGSYLGERHRVNRDVTIPYSLDKCEETGRTAALAGQESPEDAHPFYDSDIAKCLEAAAYSLQSHPDPSLAERLERYVGLFAAMQQDDGYLNSYYAAREFAGRWTNLRDNHELYCAGHMFEAAVAHAQAAARTTNADSFLGVARRYADHIAGRFGPAAEGQTPGYPGHEEIELALVKLYRATGESKYLDLARFFVFERGRDPHFFAAEAGERGEPAEPGWTQSVVAAPYSYWQAHAPVAEQTSAEGHSVRFGYLLAGMIDVARETDDAALLDSSRRLFRAMVDHRMYLTGATGSHASGERFTVDHDLPNESAYAETCAAISVVLAASRLLQIDLDGLAGDVMERALYNGVFGGVSLSGDRFYYANPLTAHPDAAKLPHVRSDMERQPWYGCACCPPNVARLVASIGSYAYSLGHATIAIHLYTESDLTFAMDSDGRSGPEGTAEGDDAAGAGESLVGTLSQTTDYPWDGEVRLRLELDHPARMALALRIPAWADGWSLTDGDGRDLTGEARVERGYAIVEREWQTSNDLVLRLPMEARRTYADHAVRENGWRVAIERGPLVYCAEEADNGPELHRLAVPVDATLASGAANDELGRYVAIETTGLTHPGREAKPVRLIPFALRANRTPGEMRVWLAEA